MCSYSCEVVTNHSPGCANACANCTWSCDVSSSTNGSNCVFTWTVTRSGCGMGDIRNGTTTVECNKQKTISFYCDDEENCVGYKLKLQGMTCPAGTGGL